MSQKNLKIGLNKDNVNQIIGAIGTAVLNKLIPTFSTSGTYTKGQYVIYNNVLYRFTADKSAGAWDTTIVEATNLNDLINDVNEGVREQVIVDQEENKNYSYQFLVNTSGELVLRLTEIA